ncbi:MAG: hypothetical protein ACOVQ0_02320 [Novosphingobium sp.]|uniref:hypothetical protein n=1 Tax=Novosphingobium sp. TaxID=1874826 RepID=UPI003B9B36CF
MTTGWKITRECRDALIVAFPPKYARTIADHVTLSISGTTLPDTIADAKIVGYADDGAGVEAMVVALEGSTARPDGKVWHVTWSLADDRSARESNDVIAQRGWTAIAQCGLHLEPAIW